MADACWRWHWLIFLWWCLALPLVESFVHREGVLLRFGRSCSNLLCRMRQESAWRRKRLWGTGFLLVQQTNR
jgi:hypothetical protein